MIFHTDSGKETLYNECPSCTKIKDLFYTHLLRLKIIWGWARNGAAAHGHILLPPEPLTIGGPGALAIPHTTLRAEPSRQSSTPFTFISFKEAWSLWGEILCWRQRLYWAYALIHNSVDCQTHRLRFGSLDLKCGQCFSCKPNLNFRWWTMR